MLLFQRLSVNKQCTSTAIVNVEVKIVLQFDYCLTTRHVRAASFKRQVDIHVARLTSLATDQYLPTISNLNRQGHVLLRLVRIVRRRCSGPSFLGKAQCNLCQSRAISPARSHTPASSWPSLLSGPCGRVLRAELVGLASLRGTSYPV